MSVPSAQSAVDQSPQSKPSRWQSRGGRLLLLGGMCVLLWSMTILLAVDELTSRRSDPFEEPVPKLGRVEIESLRLKTSDGEELGAWFVRGNPNQPAVLLMHGNGGCRSDRRAELEFLYAKNCTVLSLTMRAHGDSTGNLNDFGFSARHDVIAAVKEIKARCPQQIIVVWGGSLSAAAALFAAADLKNDVAGYLLECPYQDLPTALDHRLSRILPRWIVPIAAWNLHRGADVLLPYRRQIAPLQFANDTRFPRDLPICILAAARDTRATPDESQAIAAAIGPSAQVILIDNADHMQCFSVDRKPYEDWVAGMNYH